MDRFTDTKTFRVRNTPQVNRNLITAEAKYAQLVGKTLDDSIKELIRKFRSDFAIPSNKHPDSAKIKNAWIEYYNKFK